jgi:ESS family glutamate:Na+ symporter
MNFWDYGTWQNINQIAYLCLILLFANILRRKITILRKSLLPTAVIGGFIALLINSLNILPNGFLNPIFMQTLVYHAIAIGFISLGLKTLKNQNESIKGVALDSGLVIVGTYLLQAVIGLSITVLLGYTFFPDLFKAAGLLLPLGFGQGPGQAGNIGTVYELNGFVGGNAFGISIASFGFLWACIGGVIYMNILLRKHRLGKSEVTTSRILTSEMIQDEDEIPLAEAIDKFTVQIALVLFVYFMTFLVMFGIDYLLKDGDPEGLGIKTIRPLIWGFNFIFATILALIFKKVISNLRTSKLMGRQYPNDFMLNRIAGTAFDFMIIASITSINIADLQGLWIPFLLITTVGGFATLVYLRKVCHKIYPEYELEALVAMYGNLTGTVSTGIALLREIDPDFKTPAANNLVLGSTTAIVFGFPLLLLVGFAYRSDDWTWIVLGLVILFTFLINILLFRRQIFKRKIKVSE